ncbi:MAG: VTC domain-containing protein [Aureibaculum sp.]|nr:VTC domain-containing protein [Aureibaculum sp.]
MSKNSELNSLRYERKFFISELSKYEIEAIVKLHPSMFDEIYYERNINNIYFDSFDMTNFFDNVDGLSQRVKFRIRWYGELLGFIEKPVLEVKIKQGQLGGKLHYPLESFILDEHLTNDKMRKIISTAKIPDELKYRMMSLNFTLLNCYTRKYFQSKDKKYRITIDSDMKYVQLSHLYNSYLNELVDYSNNILELKYDKEDDEGARIITGYFLFRMTKSSKYVTGIEMLHQALM